MLFLALKYTVYIFGVSRELKPNRPSNLPQLRYSKKPTVS